MIIDHLWNLLEVLTKLQQCVTLDFKVAKVICLVMMMLIIIVIIIIIIPIIILIITCCTVVIAMRLRANGNIGNQLKIHLQKDISQDYIIYCNG